jgi:hypothetical protein
LTQEELKKFFDELKTLSSETEWVEFKEVPASFFSRIVENSNFLPPRRGRKKVGVNYYE